MIISKEDKKLLFPEKLGLSFLEKGDISEASSISIRVNLEILWKVHEQKIQLSKEIFYAGKPFEKEMKLLISIKGITHSKSAEIVALERTGTPCRFLNNG